MVWRRLSSRDLIKRLKKLGAVELPKKRGKGGHRMFARTHTDGKTYKTSVPMGRDVVAPGTQEAIRETLRLTPEDGCADDKFYG